MNIYISEKAMAPHSSTLAWKIPWMEEPCRLQSMESLRVGHGWATSLSLFTFMHWRRKWQPTPVFLPGESQERGSLVGCQTSMGSHRVGHDWSNLAAAAAYVCIYVYIYMAYTKKKQKVLSPTLSNVWLGYWWYTVPHKIHSYNGYNSYIFLW